MMTVDATQSPAAVRGPCAWCGEPIPAAARRDAVCCSKRCRQAKHRFHRAIGTAERATLPLRLAYADPPYPGNSTRYYGNHPDFAGEVDHAALIAQLSEYDGWALSTSSAALQEVLALCPPGVSVGAWTRGARPNRAAVRPLSSWEPVIFFGGRGIAQHPSRAAARDASTPAESDAFTTALDDTSLEVLADASPEDLRDASRTRSSRRIDSLVYPSRARRTDPGRVVGSKPAVFCAWIFDLLGARAGDQFDDLFPGSGGVARAWQAYTRTPATSGAVGGAAYAGEVDGRGSHG